MPLGSDRKPLLGRREVCEGGLSKGDRGSIMNVGNWSEYTSAESNISVGGGNEKNERTTPKGHQML